MVQARVLKLQDRAADAARVLLDEGRIDDPREDTLYSALLYVAAARDGSLIPLLRRFLEGSPRSVLSEPAHLSRQITADRSDWLSARGDSMFWKNYASSLPPPLVEMLEVI